jgi:hypothetical protein
MVPIMAPMDERIKKDVKLLLSLVGKMDKPEPGWDPTFYVGLDYNTDLYVYERIQEIKERYA